MLDFGREHLAWNLLQSRDVVSRRSASSVQARNKKRPASAAGSIWRGISAKS